MLPSALGNPLAAAAGLSPSPPTLVPSAMSMVSMASMLGHPGAPHFLHPGYTGAAGVPGARDAFARDDFAASMSKFMDRSFGGGDSPPPPTVPTNDPTANECKIVEYRGEKVAAFVIQGKTMLCLPQVGSLKQIFLCDYCLVLLLAFYDGFFELPFIFISRPLEISIF